MTRIVAGAAGGRRLAVPGGRTTRPTSERAREALFSTLEAMVGTLAGRRVLDLYAGSGALGLEALSRGAGHVLLVESERRAHAAVLANIDAVALPGAVASASAVERLVATEPADGGYDVALLDPPYELPAAQLREVVEALAERWLRPGAVVVVERASRERGWTWPPGIHPDRSRRYGEATLWYGRAEPAAGTPSQTPRS